MRAHRLLFFLVLVFLFIHFLWLVLGIPYVYVRERLLLVDPIFSIWWMLDIEQVELGDQNTVTSDTYIFIDIRLVVFLRIFIVQYTRFCSLLLFLSIQ